MKKILSALAFAVATTFASAGPVTITPTGLPSPGSLNLNDWEHSGAVGMTLFAGSTSTAAGVGGLKATFNDAVLGSDSFIAWCVELLTRASPFGTPAVYEQVGASSTPVNVIGKLFQASNALNTTDALLDTGVARTDNAVNSGGLQLALWELLNETSSVYDVTAGSFYATGGNGTGTAMRTHANALLGSMNSFSGSDYSITLFTDAVVGLQNGNKLYQDFITVNYSPGIGNNVPEPGSLALAGLALAGLAVVRRRKA